MIKVTLKIEKYSKEARLCENGNCPSLRHMSKSQGCECCGGPKSYRAQLCRRCAQDYVNYGPAIFSPSWYVNKDNPRRLQG